VWGKSDKPRKEDAESVPRAPSPAITVSHSIPAASSSDDDLLGLSSGVAAAPAAAPMVVDPTSVPVTQRVGVDASVRESGQLRKWLLGATLKPSGVLFEDAHVQIGVKKAIAGAEGKVTLYFGNKTSTSLHALKVRVPETPALRASVSDPAGVIAPRAQATVVISVEALTPFLEAPALQVSFISTPGTGHAYALQLPLSVANFCEPITLAADDFKSRWGALAGAPKEVKAIITPASGAPSMEEAAAAIKESLNMASVEAGAPGVTASSSFRTKSLSAAGQPVSVGCLIMALPDAASGVYKVAVRTQHESVSKAVIAALQGRLE
jgi:Alpha adaptin AP2, C-terminal domain/Adaptin C-terminal domain